VSTPSADYQQFIAGFAITDRESGEDYDLEAFSRLVGDERAQADALLLDTIRTSDDPRAARAVRYLDLRDAVPALREAVATRSGRALVQSALTLFTFTGEQSAITPIVQVLREGDTWARVDAASALAQCSGPTVENALLDAIDDPEPLVRANAVEAMLHITGLADWETVIGRGISLLGLRLRSSFASVRRHAIPDLHRLATAKRAGTPPAELGVPTEEVERSDPANRARRSLISQAGSGPWAQHFDLDALAEVAAGADDGEREWALYTLLLLLDRGDERSPGGLAAMRAPEAVEPLRDTSTTATGTMAEKISAALAALAG
jgi:hypothetical protein